MLVDPFTIIAQIVNFAILVVALRYLLYDRVVAAMDEREQRIADRLRSVEERAEVLEEEERELRRDREDLEANRDDLMDEARQAAEERRRELLEDARRQVDQQRRAWQRSLTAEQHDVRRRLQRRTADQLTLISRDALADLADAELEARVIDVVLDELDQHEEARNNLAGDGAGTALEVVTAFPVDRHRRRIEERLRSFGLGDEVTIDFVVDPDLVMGVEIHSDGRVVAWNVSDYVARLDAALGELLDELSPYPDDETAQDVSTPSASSSGHPPDEEEVESETEPDGGTDGR